MELWVDEELVAGDALGGGTLSGRTRGFFVAGHPPGVNVSSVPTLRDIPAFTGTIADVIVDDTLVHFYDPIKVSFKFLTYIKSCTSKNLLLCIITGY